MLSSFLLALPVHEFCSWLSSKLNSNENLTMDNALHMVLSSETLKNNFEIVSYLLANKVNVGVNRDDPSKRTLLHHAIQHQVTAVVFSLLLDYCELCAGDVEGKTALHLLVHAKNYDFVHELLLAADTSDKENSKMEQVLSAKDKHGTTTLHIAAQAGDAKMVRLLLQAKKSLGKALVEAKDKSGCTPLMLALASPAAASTIWRLLIHAHPKGARSTRDVHKQSAVHRAALFGLEKFFDLLEAASPEKFCNALRKQDNQGRTVLYYAVESGNEALVEKLLAKIHQHSCDSMFSLLSVLDNMENSALHLAIYQILQSPTSNHIHMARILVANGASMLVKNKQGQTPESLLKASKLNDLAHELMSLHKPVKRKRRSFGSLSLYSPRKKFHCDPESATVHSHPPLSFKRRMFSKEHDEVKSKHRKACLDLRNTSNCAWEAIIPCGDAVDMEEPTSTESNLPISEHSQDKTLQVLSELYHVEKSFVETLNDFRTFYMKPLSLLENQEPIISLRKYKILFGNSMQLYLLSSHFHTLLEASKNDIKTIAHVIAASCQTLKQAFAKYAQHYSYSEQLYQELVLKKPDFAAVCNHAEQCLGRAKHISSFSSLLVAPIQKLPRMLLLLQQLRKSMLATYLENNTVHSDTLDVLSVSIKSVEETLQFVNGKVHKKRRSLSQRLSQSLK